MLEHRLDGAAHALLHVMAVVALSLAVAGCAGSANQVTTRARSASATNSSGATVTNRQEALTASRPSAAAQMICSEEIQNAVTLILGLNGRPATSAQWVKPVYTCTYRLQEGPLRLSVTESGSDAAALRSFNELRSQYAHDGESIQTLGNFGLPAFLAADDVVVFAKDDKILRADATRLPPAVGPLHRTRRDLAYVVAASILHCWNGE